MAGRGSAPTPAITSLIADRKRGPKRGPTPWSKTIPLGHMVSQSPRETRRDETPGPARDFGVWRAKEMVDRGRIELPTPGFSVLRPGQDYRTPLDIIAMNPESCGPSRDGVLTDADQ
jgi:hypothetical protein